VRWLEEKATLCACAEGVLREVVVRAKCPDALSEFVDIPSVVAAVFDEATSRASGCSVSRIAENSLSIFDR
jgi:hypothetical protein